MGLSAPERLGSQLMHRDVCTAAAVPGASTASGHIEASAAADLMEAAEAASKELMPTESLRLMSSQVGGVSADKRHPLGAISLETAQADQGPLVY